ncbi:PLAT domain-containing protein 1-like [Neltuma alba]|uniref:PLAT domain-containing protein 1-like n=1 Tax=Neltuma alba TaxID=207710 RepID=UPI0010A2C102|nr:PLAT domain-containing protein 1-like [Prosopis alba]
MALRVIALSSLVFLLSLISFAAMAISCVVRVKTGDVQDASTDSTISLKVNTSSGNGFSVDNLEDWGIMEPDHNYFDQGKLYVFSGTGPCLDLCAITVVSDGRGTYPGWYSDYVEINVVGCYKSTKVAFPENRWLDQTAGYNLYAKSTYAPTSFV